MSQFQQPPVPFNPAQQQGGYAPQQSQYASAPQQPPQPPVPQAQPVQQQAASQAGPAEAEHTLNFNFQGIPDVKMPIDGGWRHMIIKTAPKIKDAAKEPGKKVFIATMNVNEPGKRDHDESYFTYWDINDRQDQFMIKQLFYACGIDPQPGMSTSVLVNRPFQARFEQSTGKRQDGSTAVFSNLREFAVDQRFIRNVPGVAASAPGAGASGTPGAAPPNAQQGYAPAPPQAPQGLPQAPPTYQQPPAIPQQPMAPQAPPAWPQNVPPPPPPLPFPPGISGQ